MFAVSDVSVAISVIEITLVGIYVETEMLMHQGTPVHGEVPRALHLRVLKIIITYDIFFLL